MYYINIILYNTMYHMYFYSIFKMIQYNFKSNACFELKDFSDVLYTL